MDAQTFIDEVGTRKAGEVATAAGTTYGYLWQIAKGHRNASFNLAQKLVKASGGKLDQLSLMAATKDRRASA